MAVYSPFRTCMKNVISFTGSSYRIMSNSICDVSFGGSSRRHCFHICVGQKNYNTPLTSSANSCTSIVHLPASGVGSIAKQINVNHSLRLNCIRDTRFSRKTCLDISFRSHNTNLRLLIPNKGNISKSKYNMQPGSWHQCYGSFILLGFLVCCSSSGSSWVEASDAKNMKEDNSSSSPAFLSHGKKVHTDYSVIGIPGDGRCLFRSIAHGACLRSGKPFPDENLQRKLADELRDKEGCCTSEHFKQILRERAHKNFKPVLVTISIQVANEFIKRREETEWFIEGDFNTYVRQIRKAHVWGGEPELLMASHVLQMPITVYMHAKDSGGLISIAEYGQEYGKDNPIEVLYHGFGHYDALQIPRQKGSRSRL